MGEETGKVLVTKPETCELALGLLRSELALALWRRRNVPWKVVTGRNNNPKDSTDNHPHFHPQYHSHSHYHSHPHYHCYCHCYCYCY